MEQRSKKIACSKCQGEMQRDFAAIFPWLDDTGMKCTQQAVADGRQTRRPAASSTRTGGPHPATSSVTHGVAVVAPPLRIGRLQCCESRDGD
jgi:hypothetical protein